MVESSQGYFEAYRHTLKSIQKLATESIAPIEPKFIRIGGRTSDQETIKPRTLYEVKQAAKLGSIPGGLRGPALAGIRALQKEMQAILAPLTEGQPLDEKVLKEQKIITDEQCMSLLKGAEEWIDTSLPDSVTSPLSKWVGDELVQANRTQPEDFGFAYEEVDLEYEQLKEIEAEGKVGGDDDDEVTELKIGKWEIDTNHLKESNIIGCTLTGISKYRGLLHSLEPKIVLIEEAAESRPSPSPNFDLA
ncbi:MAG: hypothetical protein Q9168_002575 [Polycauliona sp. 1 TL-2023]